MKNDKITDESLFKFMNIASQPAPGSSSAPTDLINLKQHESDLFLDIFSDDFCKIQKALARKKKKSNSLLHKTPGGLQVGGF